MHLFDIQHDGTAPNGTIHFIIKRVTKNYKGSVTIDGFVRCTCWYGAILAGRRTSTNCKHGEMMRKLVELSRTNREKIKQKTRRNLKWLK